MPSNKYRRWWCNCKTPTCIVDSACHGLGIKWRWICDRHDAKILGE